MAKDKKTALPSSLRSTTPPQTIEGLVTAIASDPSTSSEHVASIKMAAADFMLAAGTGLLQADCVLAVSPRGVLSRISDLISCESFEEHLQAIRLLQRYALRFGCRRPVATPAEQLALRKVFKYRRAYRCTSLNDLLSPRILTAYAGWLRLRLAGPVAAK